jgi:aspartyl-tRNA(Asn)/glutamyl-tRNA(Gln) amidotransferase subunit C
MPIDFETTLRTAELARLNLKSGLSPEEAPAALAKLAEELADIIGYFDILNEIDTSGVEPLYSPLLEVAGSRPDEPESRANPEDILSQAPNRLGSFFVVPKIM